MGQAQTYNCDVNGDGKVDVEDVNATINIILNLKSIRVKLLSDHDETLHLDMSGDGEVTAKDFIDLIGWKMTTKADGFIYEFEFTDELLARMLSVADPV